MMASIDASDDYSRFVCDVHDRLLAAATPELRACYAAGVPMEYEWKDGTMTMRTKVPVAVRQNGNEFIVYATSFSRES